MRKFALVFSLSLCGALCFPGLADQVSILFRDRPDSNILWQLAGTHGGGKCFSEIPIAERVRFQNLVDPFAVGHVAVKFEDPHTKQTRIVGWTPAYAKSFEDVDRLLKYYLSGAVSDTKTPVRGGFQDDTDWARGATLDPVHEIPLFATPDQVVVLADEIDRVHSRVWHGYQVLPNYNPFSESWSYPRNAFNCLEAVRRLLKVAGIRVPFEILDNGLLPMFVKTAKPYVSRRYFGETCPQDVARHTGQVPRWKF